MPRSVNRLAQQRSTCATTESPPRTHRYVSCSPAKLASGWSSQVADDRTATGSRASPHCSHSRAYARRIAASRSAGTLSAPISARARAPAAATEAVSRGSTAAIRASISPVSPPSASALR